MVIRDVFHRWNCTHAMIRRGHLLRKIVEREELRPLLLTNEEGKLLEAIGDMLEVRPPFSPALSGI
ncbi:hypothetical protein B0H17DRAFT_960339 [Mycena rosella]|uniref:Uncharacterized protein n=1 Tax=Mycena rosella TaxID=1033263 RepID=A0AAD7FW13_MYCRO|nr:hypothetical protein B0H17DRAFT_960339 [Mycena rosella]